MKLSAFLVIIAGLASPPALTAAPPVAAPAAATHACAGSDCPCQGVVSGKASAATAQPCSGKDCDCQAAVPGKVSAPPPATRVAAAAARPHAGVYGWDIMTPGERRCYELRMLSATTPAERAKVRDEYHRLMAERAKQQGINLPEVPPAD